MLKNITLSAMVLLIAFSSCEKGENGEQEDTETNQQEILEINDTVNIWLGNSKLFDLNEDESDDISIYGSYEFSAGGHNVTEIELRILNSAFSAHVETVIDSICVDTTFYTDFQTYYQYNCTNSEQFHHTKTTTFAPIFDETDVPDVTLNLVNYTPVIIYQNDYTYTDSPYPEATIYAIEFGAFSNNSGGCLLLKYEDQLIGIKIHYSTSKLIFEKVVFF